MTCRWMVYLFLLSLPVQIFFVLVGVVASTRIVLTPALWRGFHLSIEFVDFYKVSFQHLGILVKNWGLSSVLKGSCFRYYSPDIFPERLRSCQKNIFPANFCARCWCFSFHSIFSVVSSIVFGFPAMSELDSLLRALLHSWGSLWWFNVSDIFG